MDRLARKVIDYIWERTDKDWKSLIGEDNEAIPDEDALIHAALEDLTEWLAEKMLDHPLIQQAIKEARVEIREIAAENAAYERAMNGGVESQLRWHGMDVKDFI